MGEDFSISVVVVQNDKLKHLGTALFQTIIKEKPEPLLSMLPELERLGLL